MLAVLAEGTVRMQHSPSAGSRKEQVAAAVRFTFLKKGIRFSFAKGDVTVLAPHRGERRMTGGSLSSGSNPAASMSTAVNGG